MESLWSLSCDGSRLPLRLVTLFTRNSLSVCFGPSLTVEHTALQQHITDLCYVCKKEQYRLWLECDECSDTVFCTNHGCLVTVAVEKCLRTHLVPKVYHYPRDFTAAPLNEKDLKAWSPMITLAGAPELVKQFQHGHSSVGDVCSPNNWLHVAPQLLYKSLVVVLIFEGQDWTPYLDGDTIHDQLILTTTCKGAHRDLCVALAKLCHLK